MKNMENFKPNWRKIRSYIWNICLIIWMIFCLTPYEYKSFIIEPIINESRSFRLNTFDDVEFLKELGISKKAVINKINNSKIISNKQELVDRVNNVTYKYYEDTFLLNGIEDNNRMSYLYDRSSNKDYIIVKNTYYKDDELSLIHELNHLVDRHEEVSEDIIPSTLLKELHRKTYTEFFKDWNVLDREQVVKEIIFGHEYLPNTDKISSGDILYAFMASKSSYYLSDSEIYARLSVMKYFMVEKGALIDICEPIEEKHIMLMVNALRELINENLSDCNFEDDAYVLGILDRLDWIMYVPLIDYDKLDELNLIL